MMREVEIDYFTTDELQVKIIDGYFPILLSDIPSYGRFIKIKE